MYPDIQHYSSDYVCGPKTTVQNHCDGGRQRNASFKTAWTRRPQTADLGAFNYNVTTVDILSESSRECSFLCNSIQSLRPGKSSHRQTSFLAVQLRRALQVLSHVSSANAYPKIHLVHAQSVTSDTSYPLRKAVLSQRVLIAGSSFMQFITLFRVQLETFFTSGWIHR